MSAVSVLGSGGGKRRDGKPRERAPGGHRAALQRVGYGLAGIRIFLVIAQLASVTGLVNEEYLPLVSSVLVRTAELAGNSEFVGDVGSTLLAWVLALRIASLISIPLGIVFAMSKVSQASATSVISLLRPVPAVALLPPAEKLLCISRHCLPVAPQHSAVGHFFGGRHLC